MLAAKLTAHLKNTNDPRVTGGATKWIGAEYFAERDKRPVTGKVAQEALGVEEEYDYID